jgi:hypothetical protein
MKLLMMYFTPHFATSSHLGPRIHISNLLPKKLHTRATLKNIISYIFMLIFLDRRWEGRRLEVNDSNHFLILIWC